MQLKKFMCAALAAVICITPVTKATASATEPYSIVSPLYEIARDACSKLYINGTEASCTSETTSNCAVKITAEQYLQKQGLLWIWSTYDGAEWTKTVNTSYIFMSNTKTDLTSGKYRLKTIFTLTDKNGKTETITVYSDVISVG